MILSEFDIEYIDINEIKGQIIIDQLAEAPIYDENPLILDFLDEAIFTITEQQVSGNYTLMVLTCNMA